MSTQSLYQKDFYAWCIEQAQALSKRQYDLIDWDNLAEEINT